MKLLPVTLLSLACCLPAVGFAQWQWIDGSGRKVFSDRPPPADVPASKILKQPGARAVPADATDPAAATAAAAPARPAASGPQGGGKDKALEDKKKQAEAAEAEKRRAQEEQVAKAKADNCERAKRAKATLASGVRVARTNAKGEPEIMDDAARAAETRRLDAAIANDCGQ